ncbi:putative Neutral/alkaline nonlysosomal ceramidase [Candidatus Sulfopaludibacter sp. SbA4]|nr:putative Neutral/alkaline nonlysosomal ceramidase [Candidatus Sulfopaludibacter sp. SbA4]
MIATRCQTTVFLLAVLLLGGCSYHIKIAGYVPQAPTPTQAVLVGAARVDITPPPGYPLGGHSIGGQMARGYWTRLYARAFYFQRPGAQPVALISCDLFAIPEGLHARVALKLGVPPESLIISATHTHQGPAGYMSSAVFNFSGPLPGYDETLATHLVDGIAAAYDQAKANALPGASLVLRSGYALNLQRNRAVDAFFLNPHDETEDIIKKSRAAGMTCPPGAADPCPRFQAADPTLTVLQVRRDDRPFALLVFYAIHNTAISHDCTLYQADLSGYVMHLLETSTGQAHPLIAGFFNGAEGDISPRWVNQDRRDLVNLGGQLAAAVESLIAEKPGASELQTDPVISAARQEFSAVPASGLTQPLTLPGSGVGVLGGAEDGRTMLYAYGWHGGVTVRGSDVKMPALDLHHVPALEILQKILGAPGNYPQKIPVATATLGTLSLAAIPTEMTTVQGAELRAALEAAVHRPFVIVGLANEYLGYTTSESEYHAQNYEGASTMYGPHQGQVLVELLTSVARTPPAPTKKVPNLNFNAGTKFPYRFSPELFGEKYNIPYDNLEDLLEGPERRVDDAAPRFEWNEPASADWKTAQREVTILQQVDGVWKAVDDSGLDILTVLVDGRLNSNVPDPDPKVRMAVDRRVWTAVWAPEKSSATPPTGTTTSGSYIFHVKRPDRPEVCSAPFSGKVMVARVPADPIKAADTCPPYTKP